MGRIRKLPQFCAWRGEAIWLLNTLPFLCCSYPVLNFWSGLPLSKGAMKPKSDSCRRCEYEHISWVVTTCSKEKESARDIFWVQKMRLPSRSLAQGNGRVTVWTVSSPCIFWIPLALMEGFHRNLNLSPAFGPVPCVRCLQLFIHFLLNLIRIFTLCCPASAWSWQERQEPTSVSVLSKCKLH